MQCPCGSGQAYRDCCAPAHRGITWPVTAQALMRSRYSAYARLDERYLLDSWHPRTRPAPGFVHEVAWRGLSIMSTTGGGPDDARGTVEFEVTWENPDGTLESMRELSRFERLDGRWVYVDGDVA